MQLAPLFGLLAATALSGCSRGCPSSHGPDRDHRGTPADLRDATPDVPSIESTAVVTPREIERISSMSPSPDGRELAIGTYEGSVVVWDIAGGRARLKLVPSWRQERFPGSMHIPEVSDVAFSPDGTSIVAVGGVASSCYSIWDRASGAETRTQPLDYLSRIDWSRDGTLLLAYGPDMGGAKLVDLRTGRVRRTLMRKVMGGDGYPLAYGAALSPDNQIIALPEDDGWMLLYDVRTGRTRRRVCYWVEPIAGEIGGASSNAVTFDPSGSKISMGAIDPWIWDLKTLRLVLPTQATAESRPPSHCGAYLHAWSPDTRHVAALGIQGGLSILDVSTGRYVAGIRSAPDDRSRVHAVEDLDWLPSGRVVAWVHLNRLWFYRLADGEVVSLAILREPEAGSGPALLVHGTYETTRTDLESASPIVSIHPPGEELPDNYLEAFVAGLPVDPARAR